jgi:glucan biosynthesis protein C
MGPTSTDGAMAAPHATTRIYAFDWLRVLAVLAVFFGHVAYIFAVVGEPTIRNAQTSIGVSVYGAFVLQSAVPLLFLLAGVSSWFSLRTRPVRSYLHERLQRLLIPLLFGSAVLIPWIGYMSALNHGSFAGPYWQWVPIHVERTWTALHTPEFNHGLIALYYTSWHLWFLGYLLIFSVLAAGVRHEYARFPWLATLCERRAGLIVLGLPVAAFRMALGPLFPAYLDWTDTIVFLAFFIYGRLFMTDARFLRAVERDRNGWLIVACASFAMILGTHALGYLPRWVAHPDYAPDYLFYQLLLAVNTWACVVGFVGCGLRWLNVDSAALRYADGAALPFYVLHQVAVASAGTIVVEWSAGVAVKFIVISVAAFATTMLTYEFVIRRNRPVRVLFGLKAEATAPPFSPPASTIAIRESGWNARSAT